MTQFDISMFALAHRGGYRFTLTPKSGFGRGYGHSLGNCAEEQGYSR